VISRRILDTWRKVNYTRWKYNKQPDAHRQPIPTIVNCFTPPVNHQEESEAFHFLRLAEKRANVKIKNKCISKPQRNNILIIGDSHARGCAAELLSSLDMTFEVMGAVMPAPAWNISRVNSPRNKLSTP